MSEEITNTPDVPTVKEITFEGETEKGLGEKPMTDHQRWWKKQNADRVVHRKRKIAETKDISAYTIHEFMKEFSDAQEEGFVYNQWDAPYAAYTIGNLIVAKLIKYFPDEPEVPKEISPELAEIQAKFADQAGAAAKEFADPVKRGRKPVAKSV